MANTAGMCTSAKAEFLAGLHALGPTGPTRTTGVADTIKAALFLASASRGVADTTYNTTGELAGTGGYTQGGVTVTMATAPVVNSTAGCFTPSANFQWTSFTSSGAFDCCVLYNSTQASRQISVHTFSSQSITTGTFTLTMPANTIGNALLQIS